MTDGHELRLYDELASCWPLLSAPEEYEEEADFYGRLLTDACEVKPGTVLELGSGGGNNASHLKHRFAMTLVDLSPQMLEVSRALNPECEHALGDMRTVRLGRAFDAVFVHDAIMHMTTFEDLRQVFETAYTHCRPGGAALFAPDRVRETFRPSTDHGGRDAGRRGARYVAWAWDPDPRDSRFTVDFAYLLRVEDGTVRVEHERHTEGLFSRDAWMQGLRDVGFAAESLPYEFSGYEGRLEVFIGRRSAS
jgi:SAM-dependent methyltransferase